MATAKLPALKPGHWVNYVSEKGDLKAALVLGTHDTIKDKGEDAKVPALQEGYLHLLVFSPSGAAYGRASVPAQELAAKIPDYTKTQEDGSTFVHSCWIAL